MSINVKIKELRKKNNWTQEVLAKKINIQNTHISRYESGKIKPSLDVIKKFANVFNISVDYLLGDENQKTQLIKIKNEDLYNSLKEIELLTDEDKKTVKNVIDSLLIKNKVKQIKI